MSLPVLVCVLCSAVLVVHRGVLAARGPSATAPASLDDLAHQSLATIDGNLKVPGLKQPVEIIRDKQGVPHIFAKNEEDLFFAQGYVMAQDRLWQHEMWRRWREGRLAEIFGPKAFDYDARARLMKFRGPLGRRRSGAKLSPRCRAAVHGMGQWPQRLYRQPRR